MRKFLLSASLAGLLQTGVSAKAHSVSLAQGNQESQSSTKQVTGTISSIGTGGSSFTLEVNDSSKQSLQFVLDKDAKVQGSVKVGTPVMVEYQAKETGPNIAVTVTAQG